MSDTVISLARAKAAADKEYEKAFRAHLRSFKPLDIDVFWQVLDRFQTEIINGEKAGRDIESAVHNLTCSLVYRSSHGKAITGWPEDQMTAWESLARFLNRYEEVSLALSRKMSEMPNLDRSDDGYGDLMDSLPLAGKEIFTAIMEDDIANNKQLEAAFSAIPREPGLEYTAHPLKEFVLEGENYVTSTFEKALLKSFVHVTRDLDEDPYERRSGEPHAVVTMEPDRGKNDWRSTLTLSLAVRGPFHDREEAEAYSKQEGGTPVKLCGATVLR